MTTFDKAITGKATLDEPKQLDPKVLTEGADVGSW